MFVFEDPDAGTFTTWPTVDVDDWCGEFEAKAANPPAVKETPTGFRQNMP